MFNFDRDENFFNIMEAVMLEVTPDPAVHPQPGGIPHPERPSQSDGSRQQVRHPQQEGEHSIQQSRRSVRNRTINSRLGEYAVIFLQIILLIALQSITSYRHRLLK